MIEGSGFTGDVMDFTADDAGPFTATIDRGDLTVTAGVITPVTGGFAVSGTHTYVEDGSYPVAVTIIDTADATSASNSTTATVREGVLTAASTSFSFPEGTASTVTTGIFTDPGSVDPPSSFTATIDWGDGTIRRVRSSRARARIVSRALTRTSMRVLHHCDNLLREQRPGFDLDQRQRRSRKPTPSRMELIVILPAALVEASPTAGWPRPSPTRATRRTRRRLHRRDQLGRRHDHHGHTVADGTGGFTAAAPRFLEKDEPDQRGRH